MKHRTLLNLFPLIALILFSNLVRSAEHIFEDYTVHYNLLNSSFIQSEIATQYGIKRSKNLGLLNISVRKTEENAAGIAVVSNIFGHGSSLAGQLKELSFKEIKEADAIYYLAIFPINNGERLSFDLQVQPEKKGKLIPIKFKQQVFVD